MPVEDEGDRISFLEVLEHWNVLEADLHHYFGIDMGSDIVRKRDWRWFAVRVWWLMDDRGTAISRAVRPPKEPEQNSAHGDA